MLKLYDCKQMYCNFGWKLIDNVILSDCDIIAYIFVF